MSQQQSRTDQIIWWIIGALLSVILIGGSAWAASVNSKMEEISTLRVNIQYIQTDIKDIKDIIKVAVKTKFKTQEE